MWNETGRRGVAYQLAGEFPARVGRRQRGYDRRDAELIRRSFVIGDCFRLPQRQEVKNKKANYGCRLWRHHAAAERTTNGNSIIWLQRFSDLQSVLIVLRSRTASYRSPPVIVGADFSRLHSTGNETLVDNFVVRVSRLHKPRSEARIMR